MFKSVREFLAGKYPCLKTFREAVQADRAKIMEGRGDEFERFLEQFPNEGRIIERLAVHKVFFNSERMLRNHHRADWAGVDPKIRVFSGKLFEEARKRGMPLFVHCARRTAAEQRALYDKGASKVRGPRAAHTTGCAVDIVHTKFAWQMSRDEWRYIGALGKRVAKRMDLEITWGGDWGWDFAHWELPDWKTRPVIPDNLAPERFTPVGLLRFQ